MLQIDPKLKRSVTRLIRSKWAKLLKVEFDSVELTSDIGSLKRLADKTILKPAVQQHIAGVESSAPQCIDCFNSKAFIGSERRALCNACLLQRLQPSQHCSMCCRRPCCSVILHGHVTSKASSLAFNWLSFGVDLLVS